MFIKISLSKSYLKKMVLVRNTLTHWGGVGERRKMVWKQKSNKQKQKGKNLTHLTYKELVGCPLVWGLSHKWEGEVNIKTSLRILLHKAMNNEKLTVIVRRYMLHWYDRFIINVNYSQPPNRACLYAADQIGSCSPIILCISTYTDRGLKIFSQVIHVLSRLLFLQM